MSIPNLVGGVAFYLIQIFGNVSVMSQVAWQVFLVFIPVVAACLWYQVGASFSLCKEHIAPIEKMFIVNLSLFI